MTSTKYSILIIVEGSNTESFFFNSIRDEIISGIVDIGTKAIFIRPEPKIDEPKELSESPHKLTRKSRTVRPASSGEEPTEIKGIPPLKWVLEGQKELESGAYNEVWTVFDHDHHPARKEAFEEARKEVNGKQVQIAFSSIAFEYYLLLHFERLYREFNKSECRDGKVILNCFSGVHPNDCYGDSCVGGYARSKGFWKSSKGKSSMYPLIKKYLEIGFENSAWLRYQSENCEEFIPVYDRNPYINVDNLVKRLTGVEYIWTWVGLDSIVTLGKISILISREMKITLRNIGTKAILIPKDSFCKISMDGTKRVAFGTKKIIYPENSSGLDSEWVSDLENASIDRDNWYIFSLDKFKAMFDFKPALTCKKKPLKNLIKRLNDLSYKDLINLISIIKSTLSFRDQ
jgi:hypothetical protein